MVRDIRPVGRRGVTAVADAVSPALRRVLPSNDAVEPVHQGGVGIRLSSSTITLFSRQYGEGNYGEGYYTTTVLP